MKVILKLKSNSLFLEKELFNHNSSIKINKRKFECIYITIINYQV